MYKRIRELRIEYGRNEEEIASLLGLSVPQYKKLESGQLDCYPRFAIPLADLYNVSCDYIYGRTDRRESW